MFLLLSFLSPGLFPETGKEEKEEPGVTTKGSVTFGLNLSQGNTEAFGLNAGLNFSWISAKTEIILNSTINYLETDGEKKADKMAFQALLDQRLGKKVTLFMLGKPSRNIVQEIDFRLETGIGFKYDIIDNFSNTRKDFLNTDLSISAALVYEFTNRLSGDREKLCRLSLRPKLKQELSESLRFEVYLFVQPDIRNFDDYRLILGSKMVFKVSRVVSFLLQFNGEYNSVVPEGVEKQDYQLINSLSINL
jgi:hypothetical protein